MRSPRASSSWAPRLLLGLVLAILGSAPAFAGWSALATPGQPVGIFADETYVDYDPGTNSEASNLEAILSAAGHRPTPFTGLDFAVGSYTVVAIPELEQAALHSALSRAARVNLQSFVQEGGVLVTFADFQRRDLALLSTLFGWSLVDAGTTTATTSFDPSAAVGTPFASGPGSLAGLNQTLGVVTTSLPAGAHALYVETTSTTVWLVRYGQGWVLSLGWDFYDAAPVGSQNGGWLEVLLDAVELRRTSRDVGIYLGKRYVDYGIADPAAEASNVESIVRALGHPLRAFEGRDEIAHVVVYADTTFVDYDPTRASAEASALESGLLDRGHDVSTTSGTNAATFASDAEVFVIPEIEQGDLLAALDVAALQALSDYVRGGGTLILFGDANGHGAGLVNALLGASVVPVAGGLTSGEAALDTSAATDTPFATGPAVLPLQNLSWVVQGATLPARARALYTSGADVAVFAVPFWNGGIVWLGWDFYDAAPNGPQDGGWRDALDRALALRGTFDSELLRQEAIVIPELESTSDLEVELSPAARNAIIRYVSQGGRLVVAGTLNALDLLNDLFSWSLAPQTTGTPPAITSRAIGSEFEGGPATLPLLSATRLLDASSLPPRSFSYYQSEGAVGLASMPFQSGDVVYLAWDYFQSAPVGNVGEEWVETLERAVPEPSIPTAVAIGALGLGLLIPGRRRVTSAGADELRRENHFGTP